MSEPLLKEGEFYAYPVDNKPEILRVLKVLKAEKSEEIYYIFQKNGGMETLSMAQSLITLTSLEKLHATTLKGSTPPVTMSGTKPDLASML